MVSFGWRETTLRRRGSRGSSGLGGCLFNGSSSRLRLKRVFIFQSVTHIRLWGFSKSKSK